MIVHRNSFGIFPKRVDTTVALLQKRVVIYIHMCFILEINNGCKTKNDSSTSTLPHRDGRRIFCGKCII